MDALDYYRRSLAIREHIEGKNSFFCSRIYHSIGSLLKSLKKYEEAIEYLKRALVIKQKIKGKDSPYYLLTLDLLAETYEESKNLQLALNSYKE